MARNTYFSSVISGRRKIPILLAIRLTSVSWLPSLAATSAIFPWRACLTINKKKSVLFRSSEIMKLNLMLGECSSSSSTSYSYDGFHTSGHTQNSGKVALGKQRAAQLEAHSHVVQNIGSQSPLFAVCVQFWSLKSSDCIKYVLI